VKRWYLSKTLWLNAVMAAAAVAEVNFGMLRDRMSPEHYLLAIAGFAALNAMLRFVTTQSIGSEKK
jgi:hypothetical protein